MNGKNEGFLGKKIIISLCGKEYPISTHFSMLDTERYMEALEKGNAINALIEVVHYKLHKSGLQVPAIDEICLGNDDSLEYYATSIINNSSALKPLYNQTDASLPIIERFALANEQLCEECAKNIVAAMQPALKTVEEIYESIDYSWVEYYQQIVGQYQPIIDNALAQVEQVMQQTAEILAPIQNTINQFYDSFSNVIANIHIPTYTEEKKRQLEENYKVWGSTGWSVIPHAPLKLFNMVPASIEEAGKIALKYFKKEDINHFFERMKEKNIKKGDLNSAIFCFENRQYKACALLLFGIIDAKLIRLQPKNTSKNRRAVGKSAVKELERKYKQKNNAEYFLYQTVYSLGMLECLNTFFADANDFHKEPIVINRNFLDHGMNRRNVRRKDCIQLFLVLYNLMEFLESI